MKAVILAGGLGTRISEETQVRPKPMVEIGGRPILWHIMKLYSHYGINDFIICCGFKGYVIKEYFSNYFLKMSDVTIDLRNNKMAIHRERAEPWNVTIVDTGDVTMTGGRLLRVAPYLKDDENFCFTYGDGLSDIDLGALIDFHNSHSKHATLVSVVPPARFGILELDGNDVLSFQEKPKDNNHKINGGFFVLNSTVFNYIKDDTTVWEEEPLQKLAKERELKSFDHAGFWHSMDTLRDKNYLNHLWEEKKAPWKTW